MFGLSPRRGKNDPVLTCRECLGMNVKAYGPGKPVCYDLEKIDGKPVAVEVKPNRKACHCFRMNAAAPPVYRH